MPRRATVAGIAAAVLTVALLSGVAHAQDLNCSDFTYQEDAQAVFDQDPSDPNRLDEDRGPDDGIACEVLPHRSLPTLAPPTSSPAPRPASPAPRSASPTPVVSSSAGASISPAPPPTFGVRGGVGGAVTAGPSGWDVGIGAALASAGLLAAVGYLRRRRRRL
ncbi:excalibur calcium-binding protein [Streptomyces sp. ID05-04B]|uniref:excalibur calcium-binding protein n=1 Tax=unclassified Streptomyces TaxID=2593676 RepID=UPI000D19EA75|nr:MULTISPECIES: excalibur calcium-binding protein [unclassified Streptomyces]AVV47020.1 excalibur calcium-binding protein [Streptomyces sp. P3]MDX5567744.1 excalibur calcium-binding protein [Streptomyces sp. ID05-04B]